MRRGPIRTTTRMLAAAVAALGLASCTDADGAEATVVASFFTLEPEALSIDTGTTVTFVNEDSVRHTFTSGAGEADGTFDLETVAEGDAAEFTFDEAGTYPYFCEVHASMTGTITVE
ncbi:cupredoxin domain-containing protein [Nitriliruptor alkaliphilus]|uniref:cupredoxin domain-containing protein n=1 Tax=Nitriliruptor alkaliphilus TaxID=427918 RepID=UPI00069653D4|nr:cupredoxin domain-containing protein [Nitriliruptor alkaliphilus]